MIYVRCSGAATGNANDQIRIPLLYILVTEKTRLRKEEEKKKKTTTITLPPWGKTRGGKKKVGLCPEPDHSQFPQRVSSLANDV